MSTEFSKARIYRTEWLIWIGMPMLYDGGLCVNRTLEEHAESNKHTVSLTV